MKKLVSIILVLIFVFSMAPASYAQTVDSDTWKIKFTLSDNWKTERSDANQLGYYYKNDSNEKLSIMCVDTTMYASVREAKDSIDDIFDEYLSNNYLATERIYAENGNKVTVTEKYQNRRFESYNGVEYYRAEKLGYATARNSTSSYYYTTYFVAVQYGKFYVINYSCFSDKAPHFADVTKMLNSTSYKVGVGSLIGFALKTDITAKINGHDIPSFNVGGYTYVVAEHLKAYGFSVNFTESTRTLSISRDYSQKAIYTNYQKPYVAPSEVGAKELAIYKTDITTYANNSYINSYNVDGYTIVCLNDLSAFGTVSFNESSRVLSLTMSGIK